MRILIVDDEPLIVDTIRDLISHEFECDVIMAVDGLDAYEKIKAEKFDLILTDHRMPEMTGLDLVKKIRGEEGLNQNVPVIMISAYSDDVATKLTDLEHTAFHSKPIRFEGLMENISKFTGQKARSS